MKPTQLEHEQLVELFKTGEFDLLEIEAARLTGRYPESGFAWKALGTALQIQRKPSLRAFQKAAELLPDDAEVHSNFGNALRTSGMLEAAAASYRKAILLNPHHAAAHCNLGAVLKENGAYKEAVDSLHRAIEIDPKSAVLHYNLGNTLKDLGRHDQALASYRRALELEPDLTKARSNLLFTLNLLPGADAEEKFAEARRFGDHVLRNCCPYQTWTNLADPDRRLNVGMVSGDFRNHAVSYFLVNALSELRKNAAGRLNLYAYSTNSHSDELTERLQGCFHVWRCVASYSDHALAEQIRDDAIDILIDLSGHTASNRLAVFARKPAPVQVTWLGYFATTGVGAIDYLVADPWMHEKSEDRWFTERIWHLPEARLCFTVPDEDVNVSPPPALENHYVTFGCFNNLSKINAEVVAVWARILSAVPRSRLLLKSAQLKDPWIQRDVLQQFAVHGIGAERIILEMHEPRREYLAAYQRVDISLDPFPYPGGTTTVESLWMGVPVLTLAGATFLSRQGVSLLMNAGLREWVAHNVEDYVCLAAGYANDLSKLTLLRQELRQKLQSSPNFDAPRFVFNFEQMLRGMWGDWCAGRKIDNTGETSTMKKFLHVGCGMKRKDRSTAGFNTPEWTELRFDIDQNVAPDIVGTMLDMAAVDTGSVDAIYSSHNIEHLYPHEVPMALAEFRRVLKPDGFAVITCPDLQSVCALVADDKLAEPAYTSPAGPIAPLDILYGLRSSLSKGNLFMAHRCGFTQKVLTVTLRAAGFGTIAVRRREHPYYDLWALATVQQMDESVIKQLAAAHFPR